MKTLLIIAILGLLLGFSMEMQVTFRPFSIRFNDWKSGVGIILFAIGIHLMNSKIRVKSNLEGYQQGLDDMRESIQKDYHLIPKEEKKENN